MEIYEFEQKLEEGKKLAETLANLRKEFNNKLGEFTERMYRIIKVTMNEDECGEYDTENHKKEVVKFCSEMIDYLTLIHGKQQIYTDKYENLLSELENSDDELIRAAYTYSISSGDNYPRKLLGLSRSTLTEYESYIETINDVMNSFLRRG